jgi:chromosome segregation ATPase
MKQATLDSDSYFAQRQKELFVLNSKLKNDENSISKQIQEFKQPEISSVAKPGVASPRKNSAPFSSVPPPSDEAILAQANALASNKNDSLCFTVKFQKQRISQLQEDLDKLSSLLTQKDLSLRQTNSELTILKQEHSEQKTRIHRLTEENEKFKSEIASKTDLISGFESEQHELRKEIKDSETKLKFHETEKKKNETKIGKLCEENDKLKAQIKEYQDRDKSMKIRDALATGERKLQDEKAKLLEVVKKQGELIEVLRRQKTHLEASKIVKNLEEEFFN